ncbi:MAG: formyltransferase [Gammaproteobacteria bacterium]
MSPRAVVFAYHDVGDRCLRALVSEGWDVPLLITHEADPTENAWFADVGATAAEYAIPVLRPADIAQAGIERTLNQLRPDFIFSFYYRSLIGESVLKCARRAALNLHGSLLPRYRGRAPVNWAILHGERETGATLHHMVAKADAGDIVDQQAVPILGDDTAQEVMDKVTTAAEIVLARSLPLLASGTAPRVPQRLSDGQYFGRRTPEDGRIEWRWPAARIHNLVRAVAPPYPGAFADVSGQRWILERTRIVAGRTVEDRRPHLFEEEGACYIACGDGGVLKLLAASAAGVRLDLSQFAKDLALAQAPRYL